nr:anti-CBASS Acb1 family protein [Rhizobium oryzihabitans]
MDVPRFLAGGKAVDVVAEDMTREGVDINGDISPDHIEEFHVGLHNLQIWQNLNDTIKWARLYGGAVAIMLIEGRTFPRHSVATRSRRAHSRVCWFSTGGWYSPRSTSR